MCIQSRFTNGGYLEGNRMLLASCRRLKLKLSTIFDGENVILLRRMRYTPPPTFFTALLAEFMV